MGDAIAALSTAPVARTRAGARHLMNVPIVRDLSCDPRLLKIASDFIGHSGAVSSRIVRQIASRELAGRLASGHGTTVAPADRAGGMGPVVD